MKSRLPVIIGLMLLCAVPLFWRLGAVPLYLWDETRTAVNALEMAASGRLITTTYEGAPDHWHTKPPMMVWLQAGCMKLLGYNEWAVRLPSALAALATVGLVFGWLRRRGEASAGVWTALVLATTPGFVGVHVARTGDTDALLTFGLTLAVLSLFTFLESGGKWHWWGVVGGLTLAVLTKGVQGLLFMPVLLFFLAEYQKSRFRKPWFYVSIGLGMAPVIGYYALREMQDPGFLRIMAENELWGRYADTLEGHGHPFYYYLTNLLFQQRFLPWLFVLPLAVLLWRRAPRPSARPDLGRYLMLCIGWYLAVISAAGTKLYWYDAPVLPLLALFVGLYGLAPLTAMLQKNLVQAAMVLAVVGYPYALAVERARDPQPSDSKQEQYGAYLKLMPAGRPELRRFAVVYEGYNAQVVFYTKAISLTRPDYALTYFASEQNEPLPDLKPGTVVVTGEAYVYARLAQKFRLEELHRSGAFVTLRLHAS